MAIAKKGRLSPSPSDSFVCTKYLKQNIARKAKYFLELKLFITLKIAALHKDLAKVLLVKL